MNQPNIVSRQFAYLVFLLMLGSAIIFVPESITGRDAWLATILAALSGLYVLYVITTLQNMFTGMSIIKISELVLGKTAGKVLSIFYVWMVFLVALLYMYDMIIFLLVIFPNTSEIFLHFVLILSIAFILYKGVNTLARLGESLVWLVLFLVILGLLIPLITIINPENLTPVLTDYKPILAGAFYGSNWPYGELSLLALLLPFVSDLKDNKKVIFIWYFMGAALFVVRSFLVVSVLGADLLQISRFPLYEVLRLVRFSTFQRVELFFFVLWSITNFIAITLSYQSLVIGFKELFSLKTYKPLILPAGLSIAVFSLVMFPTDIDFLSVEAFVTPLHNLPIQILYPTIILIAAKMRYKKTTP